MNKTKDSIKNLFNGLSEEDYKNIADFHIHTNFSDGKYSAEEIVKQAEEKGLKYFSICDHNTFDGYRSINYQDYSGLITGIEFDCWYRGIFLHILGYGVDIDSEDMKPFLGKNKADTK